ncbi:MAG: helix-turn-helix domain-containing protein, partial [Spirochaetes bacterium]
IMTDPELSLQAKGLYALLTTYANKERECFPSINTLADVANKSCTQISTYIKELKDKKYLERRGRIMILK